MTDSAWPDSALAKLSDAITEAHARIQQDYAQINPVVAMRRGMREKGIPADALTIDCLASNKRIVLVLHDQQPDTVIYQLTHIDAKADAPFQQHAFSALSTQTLYDWIAGYFGKAT